MVNKDIVLKELEDLVAIQSVSADPNRFSEILKAADFLEKKLSFLGFKIQTVRKDGVSPLVIAEKKVSDTAKTICIYAHYDVQPEDPVEEWKSKPFELSLKNGKMYGRGIADNKGPVMQSIGAIEDLIKNNKLKNNIIFVLEGEEEAGSVGFEKLAVNAKDILSTADVYYVTDVGMHDKNVPQIFYGLRGISYFELQVNIGQRDLHSGVYGNRVLNPIQIVSEIIAKIKDSKTGKILIPGFNNSVRKLGKEELKLLRKVERSDEQEKRETNTFGVVSINKDHPSLSSKIYPSFDCNGIISGYTGPGEKTIIPKSATVKFSFRLVENQSPQEVETLVKNFIKDNLPKIVEYKIESLSQFAPFYTSLDNDYVKKTSTVLKDVFGNEVLFNRAGGSVPAAEVLQRLFKKPIILTGFTLPDDNVHSPNENYDEEMFWKGIEALQKIYSL